MNYTHQHRKTTIKKKKKKICGKTGINFNYTAYIAKISIDGLQPCDTPLDGEFGQKLANFLFMQIPSAQERNNHGKRVKVENKKGTVK